jgi:hypothetical protein
MKKSRIVIVLSALLFLAIGPAMAAEPIIKLKLNGKFCDSYPEHITKALMTVTGVKGVDLTSLSGYALVVHDGTVKSESLVEAMMHVGGFRFGDNARQQPWSCRGEIIDAKIPNGTSTR